MSTRMTKEETSTSEIVMVTIPFKRNVWKETTGGHRTKAMFMRIGDAGVTATHEGNTIGEFLMALGGVLTFKLEGDEDSELYAEPKDIWNAIVESLNKEDLKMK